MSSFRKGSRRPSDLQRASEQKQQRLTFLIVCEGEKTEPNYFRSFRVNATVAIEEAAGNTLSVVRKAAELAEKEEYDQVWCVFDKDSFPQSDFDNAIHSARAREFRVAYSNEAFELWYLLHFDYHTSALSRHDYWPRITRYLGREYKKNDASIAEDLARHTAKAIKNARKLIDEYNPHVPGADNPSTTVHELVEELLKNSVP